MYSLSNIIIEFQLNFDFLVKELCHIPFDFDENWLVNKEPVPNLNIECFTKLTDFNENFNELSHKNVSFSTKDSDSSYLDAICLLHSCESWKFHCTSIQRLVLYGDVHLMKISLINDFGYILAN